MMNEHDLHCKAIAEDLQKYASGDYFLYEGDLYDIESLEENENGYYLHPELEGIELTESDTDPASLYDYFNDYYNIDYICDSNKELTAVRVMVACGGPNIYINTWDRQVELFWWTESGKYYLDSSLCDEITSVFEEYWNC